MPHALLFEEEDFAEDRIPGRIDQVMGWIQERIPIGEIDLVDEPLAKFVRKDRRYEPQELMECVQ